MRYYLAARYSRIAELNEVRRHLESHGHTVTSRWLNGGHEIVRDTQGMSPQAADAERQRFALEDWEDMKAAEVVVSFTEEPRTTNGRGGRHVEFGGALALGKTCVVIGWRENVFHHHPDVEFYATWLDYVNAQFPYWSKGDGDGPTPPDWQAVDSAPEDVVVETKIDDGQGVRNEQRLRRRGRLWYFVDGSMYVYYTPTHWRPIDESEAGDD